MGTKSYFFFFLLLTDIRIADKGLVVELYFTHSDKYIKLDFPCRVLSRMTKECKLLIMISSVIS